MFSGAHKNLTSERYELKRPVISICVAKDRGVIVRLRNRCHGIDSIFHIATRKFNSFEANQCFHFIPPQNTRKLKVSGGYKMVILAINGLTNVLQNYIYYHLKYIPQFHYVLLSLSGNERHLQYYKLTVNTCKSEEQRM